MKLSTLVSRNRAVDRRCVHGNQWGGTCKWCDGYNNIKERLMTERTKISDAFYVAEETRVCPEDGPSYIGRTGNYRVVSRMDCDNGVRYEWVHHATIVEEDRAQRLVDQILEVGTIDESHWECSFVSRWDELPDYVLHPDRPEFN
jgi:hypothetical protein